MTLEYKLPSHPRLTGGPTVGETESRPARIAMLVALAHRFDELVRTGTVKDYAELARLGHVTGARVTQIMNLLNLAPDIPRASRFWWAADRTRKPSPAPDVERAIQAEQRGSPR